MKQAFVYTRISQDRTGDGMGVQRQEEVCRAYAEERGLQIVGVFSDNSVSAYSGRSRPQYQAMLDRLRTRDVDAVICWRMDRLHRQPIDFEEYAEICKGGRSDTPILTYSVTAGGLIDLSTADGLLRAGIMGQVARFESATKRDRARAKASQLAAQGLWLGGRRPFGWDVEAGKLVINEREAAALATAHNEVLAGRSLGSIIRDWNDGAADGHPPLLTTANKPWGYTQLRQALLRPRNAGLYEFRGETLSRDQIPAIVSEDVWRAVQTVLQEPERRRSQSNKAAHLLSGIAQCVCGKPTRSGTGSGGVDKATGKKKKHTSYRCTAKGAGHVAKREECVDSVVELWVFRLMSKTYRSQPEDPHVRADAEAATVQLDALQVREQEAGGLFASGGMTLGQLQEFNASVRRQRAELEERLANFGLAKADNLDATALLDMEIVEVERRFNAWLALPLDDRRDYIRSNLHVVLHPHTKGSPKIFDPDTVSVHLKRRGEVRRMLTAEDIAELERVSIGPDPAVWLQRFRDNRHGAVYDRSLRLKKRTTERLVQPNQAV